MFIYIYIYIYICIHWQRGGLRGEPSPASACVSEWRRQGCQTGLSPNGYGAAQQFVLAPQYDTLRFRHSRFLNLQSANFAQTFKLRTFEGRLRSRQAMFLGFENSTLTR